MARAATKKAAAKKVPAGKVVEATMSAGGGGRIGGLMLDPRAIEQAMGAAVTKALAKGITDPDEILKLKLAAREGVKAEFRKAEAKALAAVEAKAKKG